MTDQESATTYVGNFLYKPTGDGFYHMAFTFDGASLPGGDTASITAFLLDDNRAIVDYKEQHQIEPGSSEVTKQAVVVTQYSVADDRTLAIAGIGSGTPMTVVLGGGGCVAGYTFTFADDVLTSGLAGASTVLDAGLTAAPVVDPDHLDQASDGARTYFEEQVQDGDVVVIHR